MNWNLLSNLGLLCLLEALKLRKANWVGVISICKAIIGLVLYRFAKLLG